MTVVRASPRGLVIGDSLSSMVYADDPIIPDACALWTAVLSQSTGINFQSLSAPGNRVTAGSAPDASIKYNAAAFNLMRGVALPVVAILFAGTNDWAGSDTYAYHPTLPNFIADYRAIVGYWRSNGVPLICIPPLWRADEFDASSVAVSKAHPDGNFTLQGYRNWIFDLAHEYAPNAHYLPHTSFGLEPADFAGDGLHMVATGHAKVALAVEAKLREIGIIQ
ncbi:SGNH/GDSL hydrolase family protein [Bosea sp. F3-2]|uniref:SGNH/GDSL hydrolase family protein n=1 Tax=Bosea sp. F3-2 TaxID=2599640 RepID=UPI0011EC5AD6|nr:SGNH/GDSL hydrolase family protein [Bosea sp. F3-2]QEL26163.1 SGNH/GDSL hydrolase family protein [Bosea sp. F3-2]